MIETQTFWIVVGMLALSTLIIRSSIILLSARVRFPHWLKESFTYVPAAVFPALLAPMVFYQNGVVGWLSGYERGLILLIAVYVSWKTRSMFITIAFGLIGLYLLRSLN